MTLASLLLWALAAGLSERSGGGSSDDSEDEGTPSSRPDEETLAERIRGGDREAFRTFFDRHHGRLLGFVRSRGVPTGAAEDIVQDAFVYVWEHRSKIDPERSLRAYLFRIGHTRALNHQRDTSKHDPDAAPSDAETVSAAHTRRTPEDDALSAEVRRRIDAAVADLPERRRAVFELCFLEGWTYREAGEALDITRKTVENHMRLALKDLRQALAPFLDA
jgi:RNA polymerase sigma-70 factor (ECF subfamily)